jgi:ketosteroid isomerase-like protein
LTTNKEIIESYLRHYNRKDIESMLKLFSDDVVFESVSNTTGIIITNNKKELGTLALMSVEYFAERRQTVRQWIIEEDKIAIEIDYWCLIEKDLPNGKKAGEEMTLRGASFFTLKNGLIARLSDYM